MKIPKRSRNHVNPLSITHINKIKKFPEKKDIIIDIGSYRGEFVEKINQKYPLKYNFVVFEIRKTFYEYLKEKFQENNNIQVFDGDAGKSLVGMIKDLKKWGCKIDKIFINFPDPWFKKKHHKRRILNDEFLKIFDELDFDTELIFQTDQRSLFRDTEEILENNVKIRFKRFFKSIFGIKTYWEKMKEKEGARIYRLKIWKKNQYKNFWENLIEWIKK